MSLKNITFNLCKEIKKLDWRNSIKNLIFNLNHRNSSGNGQDRSQFGYLARNQYIQFLGYLNINERRSELEKQNMPYQIPELLENEKELIQKAHLLIII